jgi:hypothetical protein
MVPLIGRLSNRQIEANLVTMLTERDVRVPVRVRSHRCRCGCGQELPAGRRFVNQQHYDRSKGLSADEAVQVVEHYQRGASVKRIAREFGVAHTTVYRLLRKRGLA